VVGTGYGGFWIRVLAAIIDAVLLRVVVAPIHLFFGGLGLAGMMSGVPHARMDLAFWAVRHTHRAILWRLVVRGSHGKFLLPGDARQNGLWDEGHRSLRQPNLIRARNRQAFCEILSAMLLGVGYIMVAFTERKQGLHDLLAGTLVRRG